MDISVGFSKERMIELANQFEFMSSTLGKIAIEFEMKLGTSKYTMELQELPVQIKQDARRLEDEWWKLKNQ
ncbi:MAG: hypothetical protein WBB17_00955 [Saprospiraceae bacterium]|jgi:hypothetical protein